MLQMDIERDSGTSIHNVEEGIECWATQSMPLMIDPSFDSQESSPAVLPPAAPASDIAVICYGMVSFDFNF
jgi:hypothetical protein